MALNHSLRDHDISYPPARGQVLLLTCMDLRVLDEMADFMQHDNLSNRYDHVVFAGAALGVLEGVSTRPGKGKRERKSYWKDVFFDHLAAARKLHDIEDVYIVEHRHCGAYHKIFGVGPDYDDSPKEQRAEAACHYKYASRLKREIQSWSKDQGFKLRVELFLMDLRGRVSLLKKPS